MIFPSAGRAIVFEEVGGRTTAVVPSVQVKVTEESGGRGAKTEPAVTDVDAEESPLLKSVAVKAKPRKRKLDAAADCHQQVSAKEPNVDLREVASPVGAAMETRAKKTKEVARSRMALK